MNWLKRKTLKLGKKIIFRVKISTQSCLQLWRLKTCINTSAVTSFHLVDFTVLSYGIHWLSVFQLLLESLRHTADSQMKNRKGESVLQKFSSFSYRKGSRCPNWKCGTGWWTTKYTVKRRYCPLIRSLSFFISPVFLLLTFPVAGTEMETKVKYKPLTTLLNCPMFFKSPLFYFIICQWEKEKLAW